jgi:hypothetical protein
MKTVAILTQTVEQLEHMNEVLAALHRSGVSPEWVVFD